MAENTNYISCLSDSQQNLVQRALEKLKLKGKDYSIEPLGKVEDNYATDVRVIKVKCDNNNEFRIIAKISTSSTNAGLRVVLMGVTFSNEIAMYTEILPMFSKLQEDANVELKNRYQFPTCYGFSSEKQQEILLLEDLSKQEYTLLNKFKPLSDEIIRLVLSNLADYHSLSYALKTSSPDTFKEFSKKVIDVNSILEQFGSMMYTALGEKVSQIFDEDKYKNTIKNLFTPQRMEEDKQLREIDAQSKYTVFVHGDTWTNNILFQIEEGKATKCIFIDYQLAREAMPVTDILYLIFNCTDYETRAKHYYDWLDHYHAQLEKSLLKFDLKIDNVYPRDKFDLDMKRYAKSSLTTAIKTLSIIMREKEDSVAIKEVMSEIKEIDDMVNNIQLDTLQNESASNIQERVKGLIDSFFDFGLIN